MRTRKLGASSKADCRCPKGYTVDDRPSCWPDTSDTSGGGGYGGDHDGVEVTSVEGKLRMLLMCVAIALGPCYVARKQPSCFQLPAEDRSLRDFCYVLSFFGWCCIAMMICSAVGYDTGVVVGFISLLVVFPGYMFYSACKTPDVRSSGGGIFPDSCCCLALYPDGDHPDGLDDHGLEIIPQAPIDATIVESAVASTLGKHLQAARLASDASEAARSASDASEVITM